MLAPIADSSDFLFPDDRHSPPHFCYKHPYALPIIQLVECSPPPPRSAPSSSSYLDDSSDGSSPDDDEDDELCSSYCSSDLPPDDPVLADPVPAAPGSVPSPDTYDLRMKRILAWRENFSAAMSSALSDSTLANSLKRKFHDGDDYDDTMSHSSKRSRTSDGSTSCSSLGEHSCPACDATFSTRQSLRQHGLDAAKENEACSIAVEYAFE
ncbi:hypothetical protein APHAL10511_002378 [Amanita phalloides]|nr:hypothetical protein APHAL10511_002378 [Amanita phalloides]